MTLTTAGNVGIGTTTPSSRLDVLASGSGDVAVLRVPASSRLINFYRDSVNFAITDASGVAGNGMFGITTTNTLAFLTNSSERMRIDSSGNVGIGTSSPAARLEIAQNADNTDGPKFRIANNGNTLSNGQLIGGIDFFNGDDSGEGVGAYIYSYTTDSIGRALGQDLRFATGGNTERMRIDSSGNVFIGKTSDSDAAQGLSFYPAGSISYNDNNAGDRTPISFRRSGTQVGRIETNANNTSYLTTSSSSTGAALVNAGISFPSTQVASGGANTLDDYEEGTWTATDASGAGLTLTNTTQRYTKVGRLVTLQIDNLSWPSNASGSSTEVGGLPFVAGSISAASGGISSFTTNTVQFFIPSNESKFRLYNSPSAYTRTTNANMSEKSFYTTITYSV
jgi:hypothetical protein